MSDPRKPSQFSDTLANLVGGAVTDIREKLVEGAWFNSPLTHDGRIPHFYEVMWEAGREREAQKAEIEKGSEPASKDQCSEIER